MTTTTIAAPMFKLSAFGQNDFCVEILYDRKEGTLANCLVIINGSVARGTLDLVNYGLNTHDDNGNIVHSGIVCDGYLVDISGNSFDGPEVLVSKSDLNLW